MTDPFISSLIEKSHYSSELKEVSSKILNSQRITKSEAVLLYQNSDLSLLGLLADYKNKQINGNNVYYNRNIHVEPTNICVHNCSFCSYSHHNSTAFELSVDEMLEKIKPVSDNITEVHITGAVHPERDINYYANLINAVKQIAPNVHIKAFSAVEIEYMCNKSGVGFSEGLELLNKNGLGSLPGGGAEILDDKIRSKICSHKTNSKNWLEIHRQAHKIGIFSNATILYGHIENIEDRINHLEKIRELQDETKGFNAFIPLKYKSKNNSMSHLGEVSLVDDLKMFAISRLFLDNVPHIKAYWPMFGKQNSLLALSFGADDLDGTVNNSTQIYSLAGAEDANPDFTEEEIKEAITNVGKIPVERDSLYNAIEKHE
ncbi:MAG: CofH family radical SAM protein [Bacteroidales bacterium]|jgi:aminodeoxyfutalosine synthase